MDGWKKGGEVRMRSRARSRGVGWGKDPVKNTSARHGGNPTKAAKDRWEEKTRQSVRREELWI